MADDLADRISVGAVAVTELVPGEQRFADLSRFVLRGGASRFAPVILDHEPIRYVLPVGVPGLRLDFGTLLIQKTRCSLVWRTDPARPYQALIMELGPQTSIVQSPATVQGEVWGRFDLHHPGAAAMTFLVPPVTAPALPRMLYRVLIEEPGSRLGGFEIEPLPSAITEQAPVSSASPDTMVSTLPALAALPAEVPAAPSPAATAPSVDATVPMPAALLTPPAAVPRTAVAAAPFPMGPDAPTAPLPAVLVPPSDSLYRERARTTPESSPTAAAPAPVYASVPKPTSPPPQPTAVLAVPSPAPAAPSAAPASQPPAPASQPPAPPTGMSQGLKGFLTGFGVTVAIGAVYLVARLVGLLG